MVFSFHWKIFSGANTYILQEGEVGRFNAKKVISSGIQTVTLPVLNTNDRYSKLLSVYDTAHLYFNGEYVFGGHINRIKRRDSMLDLRIEGYTGMLKWAKTNGDSFTAKEGHDMLNIATYGLIKKYFEDDADRKTIYSSNNVDTTAQDTFDFESDNDTVYSAVQKICQQNRRSGGTTPYDFWVDYSESSSQIEMYFNVKNSGSSGVSLYAGTDFFNNYKYEVGDLDNVYNNIVVRGASKTPCPIDFKWWCDVSTLTDFWSDGTNNTVSRANTLTPPIGSYYVKNILTADDELSVSCLISDADAFDSTYTPSSLMYDDEGYIIDNTVDQYLGFWLYVGADGAAADPDQNIFLKLTPGRVGTSAQPYQVMECQYTVDDWTYNQTGSLRNISGFYTPDGLLKSVFTEKNNLLRHIKFESDDDSGSGSTNNWDDDQYIAVAGLHIFNINQLETSSVSDATSVSAYGKRSMLFTDSNLTTITACNDKRSQLLALYKDPDSKIFLNMIVPRKLSEINLGETFVVYANDVAGVTYRLVEVQYSNGGQVLVGQKSDVFVDQGSKLTSYMKNIDTGLRNVQSK